MNWKRSSLVLVAWIGMHPRAAHALLPGGGGQPETPEQAAVDTYSLALSHRPPITTQHPHPYLDNAPWRRTLDTAFSGLVRTIRASNRGRLPARTLFGAERTAWNESGTHGHRFYLVPRGWIHSHRPATLAHDVVAAKLARTDRRSGRHSGTTPVHGPVVREHSRR
jgi:hypothetical protein